MPTIDVFGTEIEQDTFGYDKGLQSTPMPTNIADETAGLMNGIDGEGDLSERGAKFLEDTGKLQTGMRVFLMI